MGGSQSSTSREEVINSLNEVTTEAIIKSTADCPLFLMVDQNMTLECTHPPEGYVDSITQQPIWYEENITCKNCMNLAVERAAFELKKDVALMRSDNPPLLDDGSEKQPLRVTELQFYQMVEANMKSCAGRCKACFFSENSMQTDFSGTVECVTSQDSVTAAQQEVENVIMQKASSDKDVFAAITAMMPLGSDESTSIRQEIQNKVTNKITVELLTQMKGDFDSVQTMTATGPGASFKGQSQQNAFTSMMKTLQEQKVYNDIENLARVDAAQEAVLEINSVKKVAGTVGNAARRFADFLISGVGLYMIIVVVVVFFVFIIFIYIFVKSGKTLKSVLTNPLGLIDNDNDDDE